MCVVSVPSMWFLCQLCGYCNRPFLCLGASAALLVQKADEERHNCSRRNGKIVFFCIGCKGFGIAWGVQPPKKIGLGIAIGQSPIEIGGAIGGAKPHEIPLWKEPRTVDDLSSTGTRYKTKTIPPGARGFGLVLFPLFLLRYVRKRKSQEREQICFEWERKTKMGE